MNFPNSLGAKALLWENNSRAAQQKNRLHINHCLSCWKNSQHKGSIIVTHHNSEKKMIDTAFIWFSNSCLVYENTQINIHYVNKITSFFKTWKPSLNVYHTHKHVSTWVVRNDKYFSFHKRLSTTQVTSHFIRITHASEHTSYNYTMNNWIIAI